MFHLAFLLARGVPDKPRQLAFRRSCNAALYVDSQRIMTLPDFTLQGMVEIPYLLVQTIVYCNIIYWMIW